MLGHSIPPMESRAFAPANISLIFETYEASPPAGRGSLGVGITLTQGVIATARRSPDRHTHITVNGTPWEFPTVRMALSLITREPLTISLVADFPFGCGFGMSGASALAAALAANDLLQLGLSRHTIGMAAHDAEVENSTGLGDVGGQYNGGVMIKTRRYEPLTVDPLPITEGTLHIQIFGPILTASVINSQAKLALINAAGSRALAAIARAGTALTLPQLLQESHTFADESGLLVSTRLLAAIATARTHGHTASMIMLGEAAVSTGPFPGSSPVTISHSGAHLL